MFLLWSAETAGVDRAAATQSRDDELIVKVVKATGS